MDLVLKSGMFPKIAATDTSDHIWKLPSELGFYVVPKWARQRVFGH